MSLDRLTNLKICIIGAGVSGLCSAKHLKQSGFKNINVYESNAQLGGIWDVERNALYKNLTTNLPHKLMQFPDLAYPKDTISEYPHCSVVCEYIKWYAQYFDLHSFIKYEHKITEIIPPKNIKSSTAKCILPKWTVFIKDKKQKQTKQHLFDCVIVCNGHYSKPFIPHFIGMHKFKKQMFHSMDYDEPNHEKFDNKTIIIIGYKSSGIDIGIEIFFECVNVSLFAVTHNVNVTEESHSYFVKHERFKYKQNILYFGDNSSVYFDDGTFCYPDIIIFCTGFYYDFEPFLSNNSLKDFSFNYSVNGLYQFTVYPHIPSLFFVGLPLQIVPCLVAHFQCQWIAKILSDLRVCGETEYEFESAYIPNKKSMNEWIKEKGQMNGKKEQMILGMKQFEFIKQLCLLSKDPVPSKLNNLRKMYENKHKPIAHLQSRM